MPIPIKPLTNSQITALVENKAGCTAINTTLSNAMEIKPFQKFMVSGENAFPIPLNKRAAIAQQSAVPNAANTPMNNPSV